MSLHCEIFDEKASHCDFQTNVCLSRQVVAALWVLWVLREPRYDGARGGFGSDWGCLCLVKVAVVDSRLK